VYFDRQFMGFVANGSFTAPVDSLATPQYSNLIMEYSGYQTFVGKLPKPVAGKTVGVGVTLNRTGYDRMGVVLFDAGLPGAELYMNGNLAGTTPDSGILMLETVPHGLYDFTVKRPGNLSITDQQYVTSNAVCTYRVSLPPAVKGDVRITTTPQGAGIYIDNRYAGLSPLTVPDVPVGNAQVKLKLDGYQEYVQEVHVAGGEPAQVDAVLVSLPPTPNQTPDCPNMTPAPTLTPLPSEGIQSPGLPAGIPGNGMVYAVLVIVIGLIGCVAVGVLLYYRKKDKSDL
jgi:hypothetical protein